MLKNKKGFTLIELMILIAIFAIVAALIVPIFMSMNNAKNITQTIEVVTQEDETKINVETPKINVEKTTPVVNKKSSKGESNKL